MNLMMIDDVELSSLVHYETIVLKKYQIGSEKKVQSSFQKYCQRNIMTKKIKGL